MPSPSDRIFDFVDALMRADSLESAVQGAAACINEITESTTTGIVILIHGGVFLESWYPEDAQRPREVVQTLKALATQAAQNRTASCMPIGGSAREPLVAQAIHLPLGHRLNGALCIVAPQRAVSHERPECVVFERLATVLAMRLDELNEIAAERRKSQQFERWFRVSDRQIRALDLERQKFAALVNSFSGGAFVASRDGVISWQTRPLFDRTGAPGDSWVGHACREFCCALGGEGHPACGECLVTRVLSTRQPAMCQLEPAGDGLPKAAHVVAAPINDLAGRAHEVIVTFQDGLPQPQRRAA